MMINLKSAPCKVLIVYYLNNLIAVSRFMLDLKKQILYESDLSGV